MVGRFERARRGACWCRRRGRGKGTWIPQIGESLCCILRKRYTSVSPGHVARATRAYLVQRAALLLLLEPRRSGLVVPDALLVALEVRVVRLVLEDLQAGHRAWETRRPSGRPATGDGIQATRRVPRLPAPRFASAGGSEGAIGRVGVVHSTSTRAGAYAGRFDSVGCLHSTRHPTISIHAPSLPDGHCPPTAHPPPLRRIIHDLSLIHI